MVITYLKKVNTTIQEDGINSTLEQIANGMRARFDNLITRGTFNFPFWLTEEFNSDKNIIDMTKNTDRKFEYRPKTKYL